tara:strand:- start:650 stop:1234 length:585 start_codon:yes stop_codon:yes gene_type:complete
MENTTNSGSLDTLNLKDTLLVSARKISNGKLSLEFAEIIKSGDRAVSALTLLNASDARFSGKPRRAWVTAEPVDAAKLFNINFGDDGDWIMTERGEVMELNILNPTYNGDRFRLQINETTQGTQYQLDNIESAAKRRGKDGEFITHEGNYVFSNTEVVMANDNDVVSHTYLESDAQSIAQVEETEDELVQVTNY